MTFAEAVHHLRVAMGNAIAVATSILLGAVLVYLTDLNTVATAAGFILVAVVPVYWMFMLADDISTRRRANRAGEVPRDAWRPPPLHVGADYPKR